MKFLKYEMDGPFEDVIAAYKHANAHSRNIIATFPDFGYTNTRVKYLFRKYPDESFIPYQIVKGFLSIASLMDYLNENFITLIEVVRVSSLFINERFAAIVRVYPHSNKPPQKLSDL